MDNAKALERMKYNLGIGIDVYTQLCGNNLPPPLSETLEAEKLAIAALEKQVAVPVLSRRREGYLRPDYYCPICHKQQKDSYKNEREGCFCERCGQRLIF